MPPNTSQSKTDPCEIHIRVSYCDEFMYFPHDLEVLMGVHDARHLVPIFILPAQWK
jgi:hypothetical protein